MAFVESLTSDDGAASDRGVRWRPLITYYGLLILVLLVALLSFGEVLGYYFTKTETGGVLHSARIFSAEDLYRILTRPIKSRFNPRAIYYRPAMTLSFSLDYALWGLTPLGYHLTDMALHLGVAGLLFRVVYLFNGRDPWSAGLAGFIYSFHPILTEVVPAIVHRQESLMASFLLLGLWGFYRREYAGGGVGSLAVALASFVLATGGKESGIIFLPLVVAHLWIYNPDRVREWGRRLAVTLRRTLPYLLTAVIYVGWWAWVTRSRALVGGGRTFKRPILRRSFWKTLYEQVYVFPARSIPFYFRALFTPFDWAYQRLWDVLEVLGLTSLAGTFFGEASLAAVLSLLVLGILTGWGWRQDWPGRWRRGSLPFRFSSFLFGASLVGVLSFPLYVGPMEWMITEAYRGEGFGWLASFMESRHDIPLSGYLTRARRRLFLGWSLLLTAGGFGMAVTRGWIERFREGLEELLTGRFGSLKPLAFHTSWLFVPALFYSVTNIRSFKHSYHGVLPLAALGATLTAGSLASFIGLVGGRRFGPASSSGSLLTGLNASLVSGLCVFHLLVLIPSAPLIRDYPAWNHAQRITRLYHRMLFPRLEKLPPGSTVQLRGVPWWTGQTRSFPHFSPMAMGLHPKPWIWMRFPDRNLRVTDVGIRSFPEPCPCPFWLEQRQLGSHSFVFVTHRVSP